MLHILQEVDEELNVYLRPTYVTEAAQSLDPLNWSQVPWQMCSTLLLLKRIEPLEN